MTTDKTPSIIAGGPRAKQRLPKRRLNDLHQSQCNKAYPGSHRQWCHHSRVRRLIAVDKYAALRSPPKQSWMSLPRWCIVLIATGALICGFSSLYDEQNVSNFMLNYSKQYQAIVHNRPDYCDHTLPLNEMFGHIRRHVLNQETALDQLEEALSRQQFQSISLLGSSGVGKSLTARVLRELFPWPENVHALTSRDISDAGRMNSLLSNLAHCGRNLILVDNLSMASRDQEIVTVVNDLVSSFGDIARHNNTHKANLKRLSIVYIFNINRWLDETSDELFASMRQLPHNQVIQYDTLERKHLESCIRHEAALEHLHLDQEYVEEMIRVTDVNVSGCKTVRAKVLIYGQPKSNNTKD
ncbi:uncharacterized protein LOC111081672 [Drosophila obscura]|uniref:uncharacterized protein LOC111081672 n=1 Tax=Drosophila obscura TaxID=7282 RepID=UPI001BB0F2D6|nr:uncharacterized protein LOC111081672 [Drosophila obscura]